MEDPLTPDPISRKAQVESPSLKAVGSLKAVEVSQTEV